MGDGDGCRSGDGVRQGGGVTWGGAWIMVGTGGMNR